MQTKKIRENLAALSFPQEKIIQMCDKTQNKAYPFSPSSGILTIHPTQAFLLWFYYMNPHDVTPHSDLALHQTVPGEIEVILAPSSPSSYKVGSLDDVGEPR